MPSPFYAPSPFLLEQTTSSWPLENISLRGKSKVNSGRTSTTQISRTLQTSMSAAKDDKEWVKAGLTKHTYYANISKQKVKDLEAEVAVLKNQLKTMSAAQYTTMQMYKAAVQQCDEWKSAAKNAHCVGCMCHNSLGLGDP